MATPEEEEAGATIKSMVADLEKLASSLQDDTFPMPPSPQSAPSSDSSPWSLDDRPSSLSTPLSDTNHRDPVAQDSVFRFGGRNASSEIVVPALVDEVENNGEGRRGRLLVHYVGGSLTFLLQIALLAWGIRQLRGALARRRLMRATSMQGVNLAKINSMPFRPADSPPFVGLSLAAVRKLVELDNVHCLLIDVRFPDAFRTQPFSIGDPINIPENEVRACLQLSELSWERRFPRARQPSKNDMLVFLSSKGFRAQRAAVVAAELGYNGCSILSGGIQTFLSDRIASELTAIKYLSRDAVALLLQEKDKRNAGEVFLQVIDVRRHDEQALYGQIAGSVNVPVEEWPKALAMEAMEWERNFHFPKISKNDVLILYSRTSKRAAWAAQHAQDLGYQRCFVYKQGSFGWRIDQAVLPYDGYEVGDAPPEPIKFELEIVDHDAANFELRHAGLLKH